MLASCLADEKIIVFFFVEMRHVKEVMLFILWQKFYSYSFSRIETSVKILLNHLCLGLLELWI